MRPRLVLPAFAVCALLTGCATPTIEGRAARGRGSYDEDLLPRPCRCR